MTANRHPNQRELASLPKELRRTTVPAAVRDWVRRQTGASVVAVRRLTGASTTAVHLVRLSDGSRLVLRRYVWPGFLVDEPVAPAREVDALRWSSAHGLPAPDVIAADVTGEAVGDSIPAILMSFCPGQAVAVPDLRLLAELAAQVHAVATDRFPHDYFRWYEGTMVEPPATSTRRRLWERAIEIWHTAMPPFEPAFIHRDFHPGNVLWRRGRPSGIVDWSSACRGPRGCDIAYCRDNLIELSGFAAADTFRDAYESVAGVVHHPYWEIASVLEREPTEVVGDRLEVGERRLTAALNSL